MNKSKQRELAKEIVEALQDCLYTGNELSDRQKRELIGIVSQKLATQKSELLEEVNKINCDFCFKRGKIWDNKLEKMIRCDGAKHKIIKVLKNSM